MNVLRTWRQYVPGTLWASCPACGPGLSSYFLFFLRRQEQFQRNPDSYNGAVRENYTWSQDYTDLELKVPVPKHVVKGKQVTARFFQLHLLSFFPETKASGCGLHWSCFATSTRLLLVFSHQHTSLRAL